MNKKILILTIILVVLTFILSAGRTISLSLTAGDLIKGESFNSVYYYGRDGKRHVFPNETTYFSWFEDFSDIKIISDSQLASISLGGNITIRPGTKLVKIQTDPKTYTVEPGGVLHWLKTEQIAEGLYGANWAQRVVDVPAVFFTNYSIGLDIESGSNYPTGSLVTPQAGGPVYYIQDNKKRHFTSEDSFISHNLIWTNIIINPTIDSLPTGEPISSREDDLYYLDISPPACVENWQCTVWSNCSNNIQTRTCTDLNNCSTTLNKPATSRSCTVSCTENWSCSSWAPSVCPVSRLQTRTCTDLNDCGTTINKPPLTRSCTYLCTENWSCGSWSACANNQQTRTCTDLNNCSTTINKSSTSQFCKLTCPFECCINEQNYFDKSCLQNKICQNHQCSSISELYTGHNDITRNRLNILFIGTDYSSFTDFEKIAKGIIAFQGENDRGLMQIKPFNEPGFTYLFNFWIDTTIAQTGVPYQNLTNQIIWETLSNALNSAITDLNNKYGTNFTRESRNFLALLIGNANPFKIPGYGYGGGSFGRNLIFTVAHSDFVWNDVIVTHVHELIHSIPELFDEYGGEVSIYDWADWQTFDYKKQLFVAGSNQDPGGKTKEQFLALSLEQQYDYVKQNTPWKNLIGNGYGQNGVIECFNETEYRKSRNYVPLISDKRCDLEIGIFEGGLLRNQYIFRSVKSNIMNYPYGRIPGEDLGFGQHVENLIRDIVTNEFDNSSTSY